MNFSSEWITEYLIYCKWQKRLSEKTIKAYRIDLEMVCRDGVLAMTGAGDTIESVSVLAEALAEIDATCLPGEKEVQPAYSIPELVCAPEQAMEAACALVPIAESIAGDAESPFPASYS